MVALVGWLLLMSLLLVPLNGQPTTTTEEGTNDTSPAYFVM